MESKNRARVIDTLIGLMCLTGAAAIGKSFVEDSKLERARREVQVMIDTDSDRVITREEWGPVYAELGVNPSENYGLDLTVSQLNQYLENHRGGQK